MQKLVRGKGAGVLTSSADTAKRVSVLLLSSTHPDVSCPSFSSVRHFCCLTSWSKPRVETVEYAQHSYPPFGSDWVTCKQEYFHTRQCYRVSPTQSSFLTLKNVAPTRLHGLKSPVSLSLWPALVRLIEVNRRELEGSQGDIITDKSFKGSKLLETLSTNISKSSKQVFPIFSHSANHVCFVLTYQDSCDDVSSVLQAVSVVAAPHEARSSHVLFIFIPVADLRQKKNICHKAGTLFPDKWFGWKVLKLKSLL